MMPGAATDLDSSVCLLELVTKYPEFMRSDKLLGRSLRAREYDRVFHDLDVDGEWFESIFSRGGIYK